MIRKYKIGVLFCGGCNCYFDRETLYDDIKQSLKNECNFIFYSDDSNENFDLILLINGCQSECLMTAEYSADMLLINNKNYDISVKLIKEKLNIS